MEEDREETSVHRAIIRETLEELKDNSAWVRANRLGRMVGGIMVSLVESCKLLTGLE